MSSPRDILQHIFLLGPLGGSMFVRLKTFVKAHIFVSALIVLLVLGGGYWIYGKLTSSSGETQYVVTTVQKGTIVVSVTGTGQVSASNQLDIKPKVSGEIIAVPVVNGQQVAAGALIAQIDPTQAQKTVRDAQANLQSAQIALEKLKEPASALTVTQAQNALSNAQDALAKLYSDSNTDVINAFLDLPDIITNLESTLYDMTASRNQSNIDYYYDYIVSYDNRAGAYRDTATGDYTTAKSAYDTAFSMYQSLGNAPDPATIEHALDQTYSAVQLAAKAVKSANAFIQLYEDTAKAHKQTPSTVADTALTNLNTYTGKLNTHLSTLLSDIGTLKQDKQSITEKQQSLQQTTGGPDALDVQSAQLNVTKAQNTLQDAQNNLDDYYVRAPFAGTIASLAVKAHDMAGSAAIATLITHAKVAQLSLNEVDVAKIALGDKATLTFDALPDLSIAGSVSEIDTVGAVSQGVVTYAVKVSFDTQDDRVKPGMSVSASIQTAVKQNIFVVPGAAVKTQGNASYVQVFNPPLPTGAGAAGAQGIPSAVPPEQIPVTIGVSNDTSTEIVSGLKEGDQVVVRTITGATQATSQTPSLLNAVGGNRGIGGAGGAGAGRALGR